MIKGYKYRIYPSVEQRILLSKYFGCTRFVYNYFLDLREKTYKNSGKTLNYTSSARLLTQLKSEDGYEWLNDVNARSLQQSLKDLSAAYKNFFERVSDRNNGLLKSRIGFPKFKKKSDKQSFRVPQRFKINGDMLVVSKITPIKIVLHRPIPENGVMKSVTISKTPTGKYFASILVELPKQEFVKVDKEIGIDLGLKSYYTDSNGNTVDNPKYLIQSQNRIKLLNRRLSRKQKGSANCNKARIALAKGHEKVANQRMDFLHKQTIKLMHENQTMGIEDLSVKNMMGNHKLAKSIADASWGEFVRQLEYKADWYGREIIKVGKFYPSSKLCSNCGYRKTDLTLKDREWICEKCGKQHDRDINAAINVRNEATRIKNNTVGHTEIANTGNSIGNVYGDNVRLPMVATISEVEKSFREKESVKSIDYRKLHMGDKD